MAGLHPAELRRLCLGRWNAAGISADAREANRVIHAVTGTGIYFI